MWWAGSARVRPWHASLLSHTTSPWQAVSSLGTQCCTHDLTKHSHTASPWHAVSVFPPEAKFLKIFEECSKLGLPLYWDLYYNLILLGVDGCLELRRYLSGFLAFFFLHSGYVTLPTGFLSSLFYFNCCFTQWIPYAAQQDLLHAHRRRACHALLPGTPVTPNTKLN